MRTDPQGPAIFLITNFPWDSPTGGACIIRHLVSQLTGQPINWFCLSAPAGKVEFVHDHVTTEYMSAPAWGNVRLRLHVFWRWYRWTIWARYVAWRIARRIKQVKPRLVWIVADFTIVPVATWLLPQLRDRRLHLSIHDHLQDSARREGFSAPLLKRIAQFETAVTVMKPTVDGVSQELIDSFILAPLAEAIVTLPVKLTASENMLRGLAADGPLTIGLSGNFWGEKELQCFAEGMELWSQKSGRDWKMQIFGRSGSIENPNRIEMRGYVPIEKVLVELGECDLLLLPLPVDPESSQMATSVPTKLVTYLEVGRLVFAFAPPRSVTKRLVEENAVGFVACCCDPRVVVDGLERLLKWDLRAAETGRQRLLADRFNEARIFRDFTRVLNI